MTKPAEVPPTPAPAAPAPAPVTPDQAQQLKDLGAELASLRADLEKAKSAGADRAELVKIQTELAETRAAIAKLSPVAPPAAEASSNAWGGFWDDLFGDE